MDPLTMGISAVSSLLPLAEKGIDLAGKGFDFAGKGLDLVTKLLDSKNQDSNKEPAKICENTHQKQSVQITYS